jgi:glutamate-1-semialdehyde 2,1-aminomutase
MRTGWFSTTEAFLPPWGKCEQWTLSVQHTLDDVARFVTNLETFAVSLRGAR